MAKAKQSKRKFTAQAESALDGLRLEQPANDPTSTAPAAPMPRIPVRKPTRAERDLLEKLIQAIESI